MEQARRFLRKAISIVNKPYMRILPGQLAFFWLMSLIPLVVVIGSLANYFSLSLDILNEINSKLPIDITILFTSTTNISGGGLNFNIIIFFFSAFILASNGMHSVIITANEIYKYEDEGIIARRIKAIAMTFVLVGLLFFLLAFIVFGNSILEIYESYATNKGFVGFFIQLFKYLNLPVALFILYFNIKQLYKMAPDEKVNEKMSTIGAIFTTAIWVVGTEIYAIYFKFFVNYNLFYGSVSNILILMIWLYFLAYVFVLGMAISCNTNE